MLKDLCVALTLPNRSTTPRSSCSSRRAFGSASRGTSKAFIRTRTRSRALCRWKRSRRSRDSRPSRQSGDQGCTRQRQNQGAPLVPLPGTRNVNGEELAGASRQGAGHLPGHVRASSISTRSALRAGEVLVARRRQSARDDGDRDRQERDHRAPDPRHLAALSGAAGPGRQPRARIDRQESSPCSRCGRTPRSESTARESASANGTRRSSSRGAERVAQRRAAWTAAPGAD